MLDPGVGMLGRAIRRSPSLAALVADGARLPVRSGAVDLLCFAQSWHWLDPGTRCEEAHRVLTSGGRWAGWWFTRPRRRRIVLSVLIRCVRERHGVGRGCERPSRLRHRRGAERRRERLCDRTQGAGLGCRGPSRHRAVRSAGICGGDRSAAARLWTASRGVGGDRGGGCDHRGADLGRGDRSHRWRVAIVPLLPIWLQDLVSCRFGSKEARVRLGASCARSRPLWDWRACQTRLSTWLRRPLGHLSGHRRSRRRSRT